MQIQPCQIHIEFYFHIFILFFITSLYMCISDTAIYKGLKTL